MKETVRLKCDAVWAIPNMVNVNEMDYDLKNEWDGNEWVGLWYMKWIDELWYIRWTRWKWLDKYVTTKLWCKSAIIDFVHKIWRGYSHPKQYAKDGSLKRASKLDRYGKGRLKVLSYVPIYT